MTVKELKAALENAPDDTEVFSVTLSEFPNDIKHVLLGGWPTEQDKPHVWLVPYGVHLSGLTDLED